ncbi:MAG: hypothetical protein K2R93_10965 [Gemmatimonadaceae bacterium]|nr:hypothetical protein [Gemmatimonadaceae bacterium]
MSLPPEVLEQEVARLLHQCHSDVPLEGMWSWRREIIAAAVQSVDLVTPALATYVVSRGYPEILLMRDDLPAEAMDAVWALLMLDLPNQHGISVRWFTAVPVLLGQLAWRQRAERFLKRSFAVFRIGGMLGDLATGREHEGYAAAAYLIIDPAEPLHVRAELLRELEREQVYTPLRSLPLTEDVLRAAYRHDPFIEPAAADALLEYPCVLADAAWCAALIEHVSHHVVADLPQRALELLPTPRNRERAIAILHDHVLEDPATAHAFAHHLWWEPPLHAVVTRADVLRCLAVVGSAEVRVALLRVLSTVGADAAVHPPCGVAEESV